MATLSNVREFVIDSLKKYHSYLSTAQADALAVTLNDFVRVADEQSYWAKLKGIAYNAQVNVIEKIQKNGVELAISNKTVNITVPTYLGDLTNNANYVVDANYVHTDNNYTNDEKNKLGGIDPGAEVNVQSDWSEDSSSSDAYIKNKPSIPAYAYWDSTNHNIVFKTSKNGTVLSSMTISGADFIKDGMIDSISIKDYSSSDQTTYGTSYLFVDFNTDSGKTDVKIPLKDIFNPNNYYTKTDIDNKYFVNSVSSSGSGNVVTSLSKGATANSIVYNLGYSAANASHTHGNITNAGEVKTYAAIANNDRLLIADTSNSYAVTYSNVVFDGSTTNKYLSPKGTWVDIPTLAVSKSGSGNVVTGITVSGHTVTYVLDKTVSLNDHGHGNILNGGTLSTSASHAIAAGDAIMIADKANSYKVSYSSITFDGSTTTKYLSQKGTWVSVPTIPNLSVATNNQSTGSNKAIGTITVSGHAISYTTIDVATKTHTHGNLSNDGKVSAVRTIASGDAIVVSYSAGIGYTSITFDGSTTSKALTPKGTWQTFLTSHQTLPQLSLSTTAKPSATVSGTTYVMSNIAVSNHTITPSYVSVLTAHQSLSNYYTKTEIQNMGYITSASIPSLSVSTDNQGTGANKAIGTISVSGHAISYTTIDVAAKSHTHGNITNGGALQEADVPVANGDKIVMTDSSNSGKIARSSTAFDGSTTSKALTPKGTWESFIPGTSQTQLSLGTTSGSGNVVTDISVSNHQITMTKGATVSLSTHAHGNLSNDGKVSAVRTIASGDALVISYSAGIGYSGITFDGSTTNQALTKKGTWGTFVTSQTTLSLSSTAKPTATVANTAYVMSNIAVSNHTITPSYVSVITSETTLSKGTTSGSGNAVTDISVSGHTITLTKGSTFLTSSDISGKENSSNKKDAIAGNETSTQYYPTTHAVAAYVGSLAELTTAELAQIFAVS